MNAFKRFMSADVITMDATLPQADAFLTWGDKFAAVGPIETIDLEDRKQRQKHAH